MTTLHLLLFLLLSCGVAQSSKLVKVSPSLLNREDTKEEDCSAAQSRKSSTSFPLMHVQAQCSPFRNNNLTWQTAMLESIKGDTLRCRATTRVATEITTQEDADVPSDSKRGNYIIKLAFGTPQQSFYTSLDTGSGISWIPCTTCTDCKGDAFDPSKSSTFKYLNCSSETCQALGSSPDCGNNNCSIRQTYGDRSKVKGLISRDSLALEFMGFQTIPDFIFGCAKSSLTSGVLGFCRDPLSFVTQTANLFDQTFSYCIPSPKVGTSCFALGKSAASSNRLQFTPLLTNAANPSLYYVGLNGISVGDDLVSVPGIEHSSGKGTIIDSGTFITWLVEPAYSSLRDSFVRHLPNLYRADPYSIFDACFNFPSGEMEVPQITLHFDNNVDVPLPPDNFLFPANEQGSVQCLAFAPPPENSSASIISRIGSYQQRNFQVAYDIPGSRLGIAQSCDCG